MAGTSAIGPSPCHPLRRPSPKPAEVEVYCPLSAIRRTHEGVLPLVLAVARRSGRGFRIRSPGRFPVRKPRQVRNVLIRSSALPSSIWLARSSRGVVLSASVVRRKPTSQPSARCMTMIVSFGPAVSSTEASTRPAWGVPVLPITPVQVARQSWLHRGPPLELHPARPEREGR